MGNNCENVKLYFKIFYRTTRPISTKLATKHPLVKGIQVYSNEGPISIKLGTNHPLVEGIQVYSNEGPNPISKGR